jgi:ABC-type transport system substrate-binding protein
LRIEVETPTRYRVRLREGLRFSDGSTLDATDVAATFRSGENAHGPDQCKFKIIGNNEHI